MHESLSKLLSGEMRADGTMPQVSKKNPHGF